MRCIVIGDPTKVQQIVMNLSTNAAHAMKEKGGTLEINLRNRKINDDSTGMVSRLAPGIMWF
jgi:signal transduction histidine kinase